MIDPVHPFQFKQFAITQERSAMKIGTDAVLLGAWANIESSHTILDIGTGTGILTLMIAQRNETASIYGIENDLDAFEEAKDNVKDSRWNQRITIIHEDVRMYIPNIKFDAIISNPPFFTTGEPSENKQRAQSRHTTTLSVGELLDSVTRLLSKTGQFHCIISSPESKTFIRLAKHYQLFVNDLVKIRPHRNKPVHRKLITFSRIKKEVRLGNMNLHDVGKRSYSDSYVSLTKDFYLYM